MVTKTVGVESFTQIDQRELSQSLSEIDSLRARSLDTTWEFTPISSRTVQTSKSLLGQVKQISNSLGTAWYAPAVGTDGEGAVSLEWRSPATALTLFANADGSTELLFSWGANIWSEMETAASPDDAQLTESWRKHYKANGKLP